MCSLGVAAKQSTIRRSRSPFRIALFYNKLPVYWDMDLGLHQRDYFHLVAISAVPFRLQSIAAARKTHSD